ncbi:Heterokaryon incompatibility protein 6, OR allele [Madurella mycetomatis]|uniref:Heterokaryon incompatibility protein 6, OR allele n=1 Tax=Madurella mycetomatis TaxID=100816 RepID=A0A175VVY1_9PEZI|nr:Heterokaryon incompatibility protein 6, OR allele [Madurella mycetomatis]
MVMPYAVVDDGETSFAVEQPNALSAPSYEYEKLPPGTHFRLLTLLPGESGRLECDITIHALDGPETLSYKALSYCWNNPKFDSLVIGGKHVPEDDPLRSEYMVCHPLWCSSGKRILISTSLRDALRKLRGKTEAVRLWVDALCINQGDNAEKGTQLLLMQRIYHAASEVCMWLGAEDESTSSALELVKTLDAVRATKPPLPHQDIYNDVEAMRRLGLPPFPSPRWGDLMRLFARPYFRRIWIVQEIVAAGLSSKLYCGGLDPVPWTTLVGAVSFLDRSRWIADLSSHFDHESSISFVLTTLDIAMVWMQGAETETDRHRIRRKAQYTRRFEATDPRDKIFALIGIINDFGHRDLLGVDSPEGSGPPQVVTKDGTLHATFKLDERGKSMEDIASEILQTSPHEAIRQLHTSLCDVLRGCVRVADVILHPDEDYTLPSFLDEFATITGKTVAGVEHICQFRRDSRGVSFDHQRVGDFAWKVVSMFSGGIELYSQIIWEHCESAIFAQLCSIPEIREEASRFREGTSWMLESLEPKPPAAPGQAGSSRAKDLTPILIGNRKTFDNLEYNIKFERQYPDWAWSAAGWVMPMYDRPVEAIYTEYTVKCIQDDGDLDILSLVEDRSVRKLSELPSWVPDFSTPMVRSPLAKRATDGRDECVYSASGRARASPRWSGQKLELAGFEMDEIAVLSSREEAADFEIRSDSKPREWAALIEPLASAYPSQGCDTTEEALWRTLIGDRDAQGRYPAPAEYARYYEAFRKILGLNAELDRRVAAGREEGPARDELLTEHGIRSADLPRLLAEKGVFMGLMAETALERRLFITKKGYLGAGPLSARVGDAVYILSGGHVPFILRKEARAGEDNAWTLIGDCYVHGVMQGETLGREGFAWSDVRLL